MELMKTVLPAVLTAAAVLAALPLIRLLILFVNRRRWKLTGENAVGMSLPVCLGGVGQWVNIRGRNRDNPVLLVIHGGPGSPMSGYSHLYQREWEEVYTVVNWDQRCVGMTYVLSGRKGAEEISVDRIVSDAEELTEYLCKTLGKERIYVLGHSWGSVVGACLARRRPDRVLAYIGVGQVVNMIENERAGYRHMRETAEREGDKKTLAALDRLAPYPDREDLEQAIMAFTALKYKKGYASVNCRSIPDSLIKIDLPAAFNPDYRLRAMLHMNDIGPYMPMMRRELLTFDLRSQSTAYDVPFFLIMGDNDWQTPFTVAKAYFDTVTAPVKAYDLIGRSGHMTMIDGKTRFDEILCAEIPQRTKPAPQAGAL